MELSKNQLFYGNESRTNLIVNYLPDSLTGAEFTSMFQSIGATKQCKLVSDKSGRNLGYGFVDYMLESDALQAVKFFNGLNFESKVIKVSYARPSSEAIKETNLYVTGLPKDWGVADFNEYFSVCGKIITSRILFDKEDGKIRSKGVGFIRFDRDYEANFAIELLHGTIPRYCVHKISVRFAKDSSKSANKKPEYCLWVANLPVYMQEMNLWDIFSPFGVVSKIELLRQGGGLLEGTNVTGTVSMRAYRDALSAVNTLNGMVIDDRFVQVSFKTF